MHNATRDLKPLRIAFLAVIGLTALSMPLASAAILHVTSNADSGANTLRGQIAAAANGDTIDFVGLTTPNTIALISGAIVIGTGGTATGKNLTITGPGANLLTITAGDSTQIFQIFSSACAISGITFTHGSALAIAGNEQLEGGGAIHVDNSFNGTTQTLTTRITSCAVTNSTAGVGGGVFIYCGNIVVDSCTFSADSCSGNFLPATPGGHPGGGGALCIAGPRVSTSSIVNCTFFGNSQNGTDQSLIDQSGGAFYDFGDTLTPGNTTIALLNCTFDANIDAHGSGSAITLENNSATVAGATLTNCLFYNNQAPSGTSQDDFQDTTVTHTRFTSSGGNICDASAASTDDGQAQFAVLTTDSFSNAEIASTIGTLGNNFGPLQTVPILHGSPAQGAAVAGNPALDERGATRHATADSGAFELIEPNITVSSGGGISSGGSLAFGTTVVGSPVQETFTIANTQTSAFALPLSVSNLMLPSGYSLIPPFPSTVPNGTPMSFIVQLDATSPGAFNGQMTFATNDGDNGDGVANPFIVNLTGAVIGPVLISKAFGGPSIPLNGTTSLTFTIVNDNVASQSNIAFTDPLPAGMVVATPSGLTGSIGGGTITAAAGGSSISLTGATLAANATGVFSVNVVGTTAGFQTNVTGAVSSTEGGTGGMASASVTVVAPPIIAKAFGASSILPNSTTTLAISITNPSANALELDGVSVTDNFPAGLVVATPNGYTDNGNLGAGAAVIATADSALVSLSGATIQPNTTATFTVNVMGTISGTVTNVTDAIMSSNGGMGGQASATLMVAAPPMFLSGPTVTPNPVVVDLAAMFSVTADMPNLTIVWDFGDGSPTAMGANVSHIYTLAGNYTATVTATNPNTTLSTSAMLAVVVMDTDVLPGTEATLLTQGTLSFNPKGDTLTLLCVMPIGANNVAGNIAVVTINGLTETFVFGANNHSTTADGRASVQHIGKNTDRVNLNVYLKGNLKPALTQGIALNASGLPELLSISVQYMGVVYSEIVPLSFKHAGKIGSGLDTAKFGFK